MPAKGQSRCWHSAGCLGAVLLSSQTVSFRQRRKLEKQSHLLRSLAGRCQFSHGSLPHTQLNSRQLFSWLALQSAASRSYLMAPIDLWQIFYLKKTQRLHQGSRVIMRMRKAWKPSETMSNESKQTNKQKKIHRKWNKTKSGVGNSQEGQTKRNARQTWCM